MSAQHTPTVLDASPKPIGAEDTDLDSRMKAAGMFTVAEMMGTTPMTRWEIHTGVRDMDSFSAWLDMKVREYTIMKAGYALGDKPNGDELYEWVEAHCAAFSTIRTNFKAVERERDADSFVDVAEDLNNRAIAAEARVAVLERALRNLIPADLPSRIEDFAPEWAEALAALSETGGPER